jgi:lipopolysaccharide transport system permease protein
MTEPEPISPPLFRIQAGERRGLGLRELVQSFELLQFLAWRDVKVRYQQTLLGAFWIVLQPLLTALVFALVFGRLSRLPSDGLPYVVFVLTGLVAWGHFASSLMSGVNNLAGSASLITKVYFPRLVLPAAAAAARLVDLLLGLLVLGGFLAWYGVRPGPSLWLFPGVALLSSLFALALSVWLSAFNLRYRDVGHALPFVLQIGMFCTPVVYPVSLVPERWRFALALNPMTGIVEAYRSTLLGRPLDWSSLGLATAVTLAILIPGLYAFRRLEPSFADVV